MKKVIFILLLFLISINIFAQKVKVDKKKGIMTIDMIDVANVSVSKNTNNQEVYTFSDLKSNDWISLQLIRVPDDSDLSYLIVTSSFSDKNSEMKYELLSLTFNINNAIGELIVKKYNFFTTNGINNEAISNFLNIENRKFSNAIEQKNTEKKALQDKLDKYSPTINSNQVLNKQTKELLVKFKHINDGLNLYLINDPQDNNLAILRFQEADTPKSFYLYTYDGKTFPFYANTIDDAKYKAVTTLILNDYMGNDSNAYIVRKAMINAENDQLQANAEQIAIENEKRSKVYGIATLENDDILEGYFKVKFRETPEGKLFKENTNNLLINLSPNANFLTYYYKDDKGKDKLKIYSKKQVHSFKVINKESEQDEEEMYIKLDYIEEPIPQSEGKIAVTDDGSLGLVSTGLRLIKGKSTPKEKMKQTFAYIAVENSKVKLYFMDEDIFITDNKTNRTIRLNKETLDSQLQKIAEDCSKVTNNIEKGMYEYTRNAMLLFTEDIEKCN